MTTSGSTFTEDEYKTRTYEDLSSEFQKLYPQAVRAYQLIPQMYNRLTIVDRLSHKEAMLKIANDHKHLPGFSDRNVRRYLPSYNPNRPRRVRTPRPKNSATISVDNPKLSMSEHKQNELINASTSTHIETSSSTDMDYDVTKISPLQLDKRGQIVSPPSSSHHHHQPRLQSQLLIIFLHRLIIVIKCKMTKMTIICTLNFGYQYMKS